MNKNTPSQKPLIHSQTGSSYTMGDDNPPNIDAANQASDRQRATRDELGPEDILVGRGFQYEGHSGNVRFYHTVDASITEYFGVTTKKEKTNIVKRIYNQLTEGGRFMKYDSASRTYVVVDEKEARQKISHALRYRRQTVFQGIDPVVDATSTMSATSPDVQADREESAARADAVDSPVENSRDSQKTDSLIETETKIEAYVIEQNSSSTALFSEKRLEEAIGKPGEMEIALLHSLEDFSTIGGSDDTISQKKPAPFPPGMKSTPILPEAVEVNRFDMAKLPGFLSHPTNAAEVDQGGNDSIAGNATPQHSTTFMRHFYAAARAGDSLDDFSPLDDSSPELSALLSPDDLGTKEDSPNT